MTTKRERKYAQDFSGDSVTQQHFKNQCDVNQIVAAYEATGVDPYAHRAQQQNFGFATSKTFEQASREIAEVHSAFAALPSKERSAFANDPAQWIEAINTPAEIVEEIIDSAGPESPSEEAPTPPKTEPLDII